MGAWGTGLYSDDTTSEVRDQFKAALESGASHAAAEATILARYEDLLTDHQVACLVYFALADTEWKFGCLSAKVKKKAAALLDGGGDLAYWQADAPRDVPARTRVLSALRAKLDAAQPPLKVVKPKRAAAPRKQLDAPIGSIFGFPLAGGASALLWFAGLRPVGAREEAVFCLLPWRGKGLPPPEAVDALCAQVLPVGDVSEFSIIIDGRRKLGGHLIETGLSTRVALQLDHGRYVAFGVEALARELAAALAA